MFISFFLDQTGRPLASLARQTQTDAKILCIHKVFDAGSDISVAAGRGAAGLIVEETL
jgi:hypothetical protein